MLPAHYKKEVPSYFCRFTFGQFFTLLVLEIFTLFFIFYLGARYGKEFLGLPSATTAKDATLPEIKSTDLTAVATTKDPEIHALAKEILEAAPTPDLKERVAEMLEEGKGTTDQLPNKEKIKPVIQTAPADAKFTIQVGSYTNPDEAHQVVGQWKSKGYPTFLVSADIPGKGRWYRVRLGSFQTKPEAQVFLDQFKQKEGVEAFIASNF